MFASPSVRSPMDTSPSGTKEQGNRVQAWTLVDGVSRRITSARPRGPSQTEPNLGVYSHTLYPLPREVRKRVMWDVFGPSLGRKG